LKIATFNVNDVKMRLTNLLGWLRRAQRDVACLQELKAADSEFPIAAIKKAGYDAIWRGQKSWNGVAILGRDCEPVVTRTRLPGDPEDTQSRYIEAAVNGVLIATVYAPNGNPQPGPKFAGIRSDGEQRDTTSCNADGSGRHPLYDCTSSNICRRI